MADSPRLPHHVNAPVGAAPTITGISPDAAADSASQTSDHLHAGKRAEPLPARVGRYVVVGEVARGGMGIVCLARDEAVGRDVAVKVLHARLRERPAAVARFIEEARITGRLQHPGIPPVFDVGRDDDGNPYFAMKLIKGGTLADFLGRGPAPELLPEVERVCQAVGYAHMRGVIHRDLKPANIMVGGYGEVQVMDWGLAKLLTDTATGESASCATSEVTAIQDPREDSDGSQTQAGSVLGTPAYMPPEQAAGAVALVDRRADVFGLGAILCTVLTGKPPFLGDSAESTRLMAVQGRLEACFARLDACGADRDLIDLCKRCLCADPAGRPNDAGEVARAIGAFRAAAVDRARKAELEKSRRRWLVAVAVVLLLGTGVATGFGVWGMANAHRADGEALRADGEADAAKAEAARAIAAEREAQRLLGLMNVDDGMAQADRGRPATGLLRMAHALTVSSDHREIEDSVRMLFPGYRRYGRAASAELIHQAVFPNSTRSRVFGFSPDGRIALTSTDDGQAKLWSIPSQQLLATLPGSTYWRSNDLLSDDGRLIALAKGDSVSVFDWTMNPSSPVASFRIDGSFSSALALSPDGKRLAVRDAKKGHQVYDVVRRQPAGVLLPHDFGFFDRECRVFFTVMAEQGLLLDAITGRTLGTLQGRFQPVPLAVFDPSGRFLALGGIDGDVAIWDTVTGRPGPTERIATGRAYNLVWGPDGRRLATSVVDGLVRVWDVPNNRLLAALPGHSELGGAIRFSPDGRQVLTGGKGGVVRVWDLAGGRGEFVGRGHANRAYTLAWDAEGKRLVSGDWNGIAYVWNPPADRAITPPMSHGTGGFVANVQFSRDGKRVLTISRDNVLHVWNSVTGTKEAEFDRLGEAPGYASAELSRDGERVAIPSKDGSIRILEVATGHESHKLEPAGAKADQGIFSPEGNRIGVLYTSGQTGVWELATRRELWRAGNEGQVWWPRFTPDGRRFAVPLDDGTVRIRDADSGREVATFRGHTGMVRVAFTPDSRRAVTAGAEGTALVWDVETGRQLVVLQGLSTRMNLPVVSPDGRRISGTMFDATTRVWDIETGRPLTPPLNAGIGVAAVQFSPDSRRLATGGRDGTIRVWDISPDTRPAADLEAIAKLLSGQNVTPAGATVPVPPEELDRLYRGLREKHPADFAVSPAAIKSWREAEIRDCMKEGNLRAAEFHFWARVAELAQPR